MKNFFLVAASVSEWSDFHSLARDAQIDDLVEQVRLAQPDVVAITAAMMHPTGLDRFARHFPERVFDVGIAEQHAVTSAAGLAAAGLHPVVAVYATFLNRAFDQVLMDVALHRLGVTFVLDRAGVTGPDGPSHNGMWDLSILGVVPGLRLAAPRDEERLTEALQRAVTIADAPTVLRFSKEQLPAPIPAVRRQGTVDVLAAGDTPRVLVVGYGQLCGLALEVGRRLGDKGIGVTVVDPVWALPVSPDLVRLVAEHELVVTVEDGGVAGGLGSRLSQEARAAGIDTPLREFGIPQDFLPQGNRSELLEAVGLSGKRIAREVVEAFAAQLRGATASRAPQL